MVTAFAFCATGASGAQAAGTTSAAHERAAALVDGSRAGLPQDQVVDCVAPAGDPEPGSAEWIQRDTVNQYCAGLRIRDQLASPAYGYGNITQGLTQYFEQWADQLADPTPSARRRHHADPGLEGRRRVPHRQALDGGGPRQRRARRVQGRSTARRCAATCSRRPPSVKRPKGGFPGVVITDGSVQAYEELYYWAAEDLAEAGYVVMTYDVQGQGDSDLAGDDCPGECSGVPYQQDFNFYQGAEDSLSFFLVERRTRSARRSTSRASASPATSSAPPPSATSASATSA